MTSQIDISAALNCLMDSGANPKNRNTCTVDVTGDAAIENVQEVGTTEEALAQGDIVTVGWMWVYNTDGTNYVELGMSTGVYQVRVEAGEVQVFRWNAATAIYAKANSSAVLLHYILVED